MTSAASPIQSSPIPLLTAEFWQETFALARRLFIQLQRRPATLLVGIIQPLLWLILFGALFQNAPAGIFGAGQNYTQFLGAGVIVFTAFGGALNAGVPVMFDREFGFLNRLLVAPLTSRFSIVLASSLFIVSVALLQTAAIVGADYVLGRRNGWRCCTRSQRQFAPAWSPPLSSTRLPSRLVRLFRRMCVSWPFGSRNRRCCILWASMRRSSPLPCA